MRISINEVAPEGYQAVSNLSAYVDGAVDKRVLTLVKLRASVLNGCTYCLDMHSREGTRHGESAQRLFAVAAWRDAPFFDARERAALALTDAVTRLGEHGVPDEVWQEATAVWSEREVADLVLAIALINVWNRIAVTARIPPPVTG